MNKKVDLTRIKNYPLQESKAPSNEPGTAKVGAVSKVQNCNRGDPLGFLKLQLVAQYEKNEGGPFGEFKKISRKKFKMTFLNCLTLPKNLKGPFGIF